jgi:hypothetical protein
MKCTVVPPMNLYHPVLPFRCNKKLLFCLCRTCVFEKTCVENVSISPMLKEPLAGRDKNGGRKELQNT